MQNDPAHSAGRAARNSERIDGRRQGQGWFLENAAAHALLQKGYSPNTRVRVWQREVDVVARRTWPAWPHRDDGPLAPKRVVVSCVDWFTKKITPCRLWRLITMGFTLRAEPILVRNHRAELTSTAREIAEHWRVRDVTYRDLQEGTILPEPEMPATEYNPWFPSPMEDEVSLGDQTGPDYYYDIPTPELEQHPLDRVYRETRR